MAAVRRFPPNCWQLQGTRGIGGCNSNYSETVSISAALALEDCSIPSPVISANGSASICNNGDAVTLTASGCAGTVQWSNQQSGITITVNPTSTTAYSAVCMSGQCVSEPSVPISIAVGYPTAPIIAADSTLVCAGQSITLTAVGTCEGTFVWSDGVNGRTSVVKPSSTTEYTAVCKMGSCESVKSNKVKITVRTSGCQ